MLGVVGHAGHELVIGRLVRSLIMREERAHRDRELIISQPLNLDVVTDVADARLAEVLAARQHGLPVMEQAPAQLQEIRKREV